MDKKTNRLLFPGGSFRNSMSWLRKIGFIDFLIKTFGPEGIFSSGQEGHAFLIGITEVVAFWLPRFSMPVNYEANGNPLHEFHYYMFGRACGVIFWLWCIIPVFILILKGVL